MNFPGKNDYIDIHTHDGIAVKGVFSVSNLMAHEGRIPENTPGITYTCGIHPWYLTQSNHENLLVSVRKTAADPDIAAVGEAGFDKIKGPSPDLQRHVFEEQVAISEELKKPVVIHCVRAWEELLGAHKNMNPKMPWLVHGFRGKRDLAMQLISKGMYISFWFDFIIQSASSELIRNLPGDRIFLETDGAEVRIADIYNKVSADLGVTVTGLKNQILKNFNSLFNK